MRCVYLDHSGTPLHPTNRALHVHVRIQRARARVIHSKSRADKQDPRRGPTPAEVELEERNPDMYGEPSARCVMI